MSLENEYNQLPEETETDWYYRIIFGKVNKEVKMSWNDICLMLGLSCSGEYLRKIAYGIKAYADYLDARNEESRAAGRNQTLFDELEEKKMALEREKMRMQDQRRELKKQLRMWSRAQHVQEEIAKAIEKNIDLPVLHTKNPKKEIGTQEGVLLLSDWHIGQYSKNFTNTFNSVEFEKRIQKLVDKTIEYGHQNHIKKLHVFSLGDFINGLIHVTTRIDNTEDVIHQSMRAAETLCRILGRLSEEFEIVNTYFARGNHDRVTANKKESIAKESFFDIIPWYCQARLEGIDNIKLIHNEYDDEIVVTDICGYKVFAVHGHRDKMSSVVQNLSTMLKIIPDFVFMGHFHHGAESEINGAEVVVNGSLCGTDEYALNLRRTAKAMQKFMVFNEEGRLCTYDINVA